MLPHPGRSLHERLDLLAVHDTDLSVTGSRPSCGEKETAARRRPRRRSWSPFHRRHCRRLPDEEPLDDAEDRGAEEGLGLEREDPDDRTPDEPEEERDGARAGGDETDDLPVDGALRVCVGGRT